MDSQASIYLGVGLLLWLFFALLYFFTYGKNRGTPKMENPPTPPAKRQYSGYQPQETTQTPSPKCSGIPRFVITNA